MITPENLKQFATSKKNENSKFFERLKKSKPANLDQLTNQFHDKAFEHIDCLKCANCCKSPGNSIRADVSES